VKKYKIATKKITSFAIEATFLCKVAYLIGFDLLRTKLCIINTFGKQLPFEKRVKLKMKLKWLPTWK